MTTTPRKSTAARKSAPRKPRKAPAKKAAPRAASVTALPLVRPEGTWAKIKASAETTRENYPTAEVPPYVIEDVPGDPIVIPAPRTNGQQIIIAELTESDGTIKSKHLRQLLAAACGEEAWPRVWELLRDEDDHVLVAFINDMRTFWNATPGVGNEAVPGKRLP